MRLKKTEHDGSVLKQDRWDYFLLLHQENNGVGHPKIELDRIIFVDTGQ